MSQTLSQIKGLLEMHGLRPKHRFGQNFLHDGNQMQKIMAAAEIAAGDRILEVGPGTGALSVRLLEAGARLLAVEIDSDLRPILEGQFENYPGKTELIVADVLKGKHELNPQVVEGLRRLVGGQSHGQTSLPMPPDDASMPHDEGVGAAPQLFKLVANLPYNVASPLLINLVSGQGLGRLQMAMAVVMIQKEVATRLTAGPGGRDFGPLSVMIQAICEVQQVATLSPGCFWPAPDVDSAVVLLKRRKSPLTDDPGRLSSLLQTLFTKRRKQLGAILGRSRPFPEGVEPDRRPEQLTVEQLVTLSRWYN